MPTKKRAANDAPGTTATSASSSTRDPVAIPVEVITPDDPGWIQADAVEVHQGAVARVDTSSLSVTQGAIGAARADRVDVRMGAVGAVMAREVSIQQGGANALLAQHATIEQALVQTVVAQHVEIRKPSFAIVVIAQRVSGEVRALFDWRGALAFGAAFAVLTRLLGGGRGRRTRRR